MTEKAKEKKSKWSCFILLVVILLGVLLGVEVYSSASLLRGLIDKVCDTETTGINCGSVVRTQQQQRNFENLCDNPRLTCIEGNDEKWWEEQWRFEGDQELIDKVCDTKTTGIDCNSVELNPREQRQQRNFESLCDNPRLTCLETDLGWQFEGDQTLIDRVCDTDLTGMICEPLQ